MIPLTSYCSNYRDNVTVAALPGVSFEDDKNNDDYVNLSTLNNVTSSMSLEELCTTYIMKSAEGDGLPTGGWDQCNL